MYELWYCRLVVVASYKILIFEFTFLSVSCGSADLQLLLHTEYAVHISVCVSYGAADLQLLLYTVL